MRKGWIVNCSKACGSSLSWKIFFITVKNLFTFFITVNKFFYSFEIFLCAPNKYARKSSVLAFCFQRLLFFLFALIPAYLVPLLEPRAPPPLREPGPPKIEALPQTKEPQYSWMLKNSHLGVRWKVPFFAARKLQIWCRIFFPIFALFQMFIPARLPNSRITSGIKSKNAAELIFIRFE